MVTVSFVIQYFGNPRFVINLWNRVNNTKFKIKFSHRCISISKLQGKSSDDLGADTVAATVGLVGVMNRLLKVNRN